MPDRDGQVVCHALEDLSRLDELLTCELAEPEPVSEFENGKGERHGWNLGIRIRDRPVHLGSQPDLTFR